MTDLSGYYHLNDNTANGRLDVYLNGMNGPDGYGHDHYWAHFRQDGSNYQADYVNRSSQRSAMARGLGGAALNGF